MGTKNKKSLFIEFDDNSFTLVVGEYDDELNFKVLEKDILKTPGYKDG